MKTDLDNHETHEMTRKKTAPGLRRSCVQFVLLSCVLCISWFQSSGATNETAEILPPCCRPLAAQTNYTDKSLFPLGSTWTSDAGRPAKLGVLRGKPDDAQELAALLGVIYRQDAKGDFAHSNLITVLNVEGEIMRQQPGINLPPDEIIAKLKTVIAP